MMPKGKPFSSQAQRGLMHAVAEGRARNTGISQAAAKRMVAEDAGGKLPAKKGNPCKPDRKSRISSSLKTAMLRNQRKNNMD